MKIIYGVNKIGKFKRPVVALGVFDGVHLGHRRILKAAVEKARRIKGTSVVVTFWPDPHKESSLYSLEHRLRLIGELGLDVSVVINFNKAFSRLSPQDFVKDILVKRLGVHYVYTGSNYRFGKHASGDFRLLDKLSGTCHFKAKAFNIIKKDRQPVSSTYIRKLILKGELNSAERLLSKPVSILGTVVKGDSLAARLGFPTANINPHHEILPPSGIYAVKVILDNKEYNGICYIGTRPTLGKREKRVEAHIFNFKKDIYGKYIEIQFVKKIRKDKKFATKEALALQIKKDVFSASKAFSPHS